MRTKQCKKCGSAFDTDRQGAYLCPACAAASRRASVYRERVCIDCGTTFMGYPKSRRCPPCQAVANRESDKRRKHGASRPLGSIDTCKCCGAEYIVNSGRQRYCKACAPEAVRCNIQSHKRAYNQINKDTISRQKAANRSYNKICVICGKVFDADTSTVTCSAGCAAERLRRQRQRADQKRSPGKRKRRTEDE